MTHEKTELMRQRIFAIARGYPDGNDARELSDDPLHKLAIGRDPVHGGSLAPQPTLSRFENGAGRVDLFRMADALADPNLGDRSQGLSLVAIHAEEHCGAGQGAGGPALQCFEVPLVLTARTVATRATQTLTVVW